MIFNAKLQRIDAVASATPGGDEQWTAGSTIDIDCTLDEPSSTQRWTITQLEVDATAVLYVLIDAGVVLAKGMKVAVQLLDRNGQAIGDVQELVIRNVRTRVHLTQDHYECFVRSVG